MKQTFIFFLFSFLFFTSQHCKAQSPSWSVGLQYNYSSGANSVIQTKDGGYLVGGNGEAMIQQILAANVAKLDSEGNMQWAFQPGFYCNAINNAHDGGYVVVGNTSPYETTGGYDVYVSKLDSMGNGQWLETIGGIRDDAGYSIIATKDGGYAVTGYTASFFLNDTNVYVIKLNSGGNLQWSKTIGGTNPIGEDIGYAITQTKDGGYAITGSTTSFGAGGEDVYVIKLDSSGNLQWTKTIGGAKNDWGNSIIQCKDGGYAITGVTYSFADSVNGDVYIIKLDSLGILQWTKTLGGTGTDIGQTIAQGSDKGYAITGTTNSYGGGATITYYIKLDSLGIVTQTRTFGVPTGATINYAMQTKTGGFAAVGNIPLSFSEYLVMALDSSGSNCSARGSGGIISGGGTAGSGGIVTTSDSGRVEKNGFIYTQVYGQGETYVCSKNSGGLLVIPTVTNTSCKNYPDGSISLAVSGGYTPYTYTWSPNVSTVSSATGLSPGTYIVTVKDSLNDSVTMVMPLYYSSNVYINCYVTNQTCNGSTGSITIASISGTPPFSYAWSNGGTSSSDSNLTAGIYRVTVTDSCGGSITDTFQVSMVTDLRDSIISVTNVSCYNDSNGAATIGVKGSSTPFTYLWSNGNTTATATGLKPGTYSVTVTDSCGGSATASVTITMPAPWQINISSITNVSCFGGNNGSATSNLTVPLVANYTFEPAVQHFKVPPGVTTITVSIAGAQGGGGALGGPGASFTGTATVIPGDILSVAVGQQGGGYGFGGGGGASWVYDSNVVLYNPIGTLGLIAIAGGGGGAGSESSTGFHHWAYFGGPGGTDLVTNATNFGTAGHGASGTGGNGGNTYYGAGGAGWLSNGQSAYHDAGGMDEAHHFSSVQNGIGGFGGGGTGWGKCMMGCTFGGGGGGGYNGGGAGLGGCGGGSYFVNTLPIVQDNQDGNGFVRISYVITGYDSTFTYKWSNGETTYTAIGLSAGTYTLTVSNGNGCSATTSVIITQPASAISIKPDSVSDNGSCNGAAWVAVSGGTPGYNYLWTGGNTTDSIGNECHGYYCCVVTDAGGCKDSVCVNIVLYTGINSVKGESSEVTVYPNPSTGIFTFTLSHPELVSRSQTIEAYNVLGEKIYSSNYSLCTNHYSLNLSNQPNGIYFYRVIATDGRVIGEGKLVIEK